MKILRLTIKNLNSLNGEFKIDFTKSPLADTGLFAITGETGAGKSTILDAIALAMYNTIPRGSSEDDIMSHGTGEAMAEVEFFTNGKTYRSTWMRTRAFKKPDGALQNSILKLADISNPENPKIIAEKKRDVEIEIKEITGLDVDKFKQSVLLAQGEFAAFMKAKANDRGELLEKITQQTDYSKYSKAAYEKYKTEQKKLEEIQSKINDNAILTDVEIEELKSIIKELNIKTNENKIQQDKIKENIKWLDTINAKTKEIIDAEEILSKANINIKNANEIQQKVTTHDELAHFAKDLELLKSKLTEQKTYSENIEKFNNLLPKLQEKKNISDKTLLDIENRFNTLQKEYKLKEPEFEKAAKLDVEITNLAQNKTDAEKEYINVVEKEKDFIHQLEILKSQQRIKSENVKTKTEWLKNNTNFKQINEIKGKISIQLNNLYKHTENLANIEKEHVIILKELNITAKEIEEKKNYLTNQKNSLSNTENAILEYKKKIEEISNGEIISILKNKENLLRIEAENLKELLKISEEHIRLHNELSSTNSELNNKEEQQKLFEKEEKECEKLISTYNQLIENLEKLKEQELLISKYEHDRQKLVANMPCPLCGAIEHPFINEEINYNINKTEIELKKAKNNLENEHKRTIKIAQLKPKQEEINKIKSTIKTLESNLKNNKLQFETESNNLNIKELNIEKSDSIKEIYNNSLLALKNISENIVNIEKNELKIKDLQNNENEIKSLIHKNEIKLGEITALHNQSKIKENDLKNNIAKLKNNCSEIETEVTNQISSYNIIFQPTKPHKIIAELELLDKQYKDTEDEIIILNTSLTEINSEINSISQNIDKLKTTDIPQRKKRLESVNTSYNNSIEERKKVLNGRNIKEVKEEYDKQIATLNLKLISLKEESKNITEDLKETEINYKNTENHLNTIKKEASKIEKDILTKANSKFSNIEQLTRLIMNEEDYRAAKKQIDNLKEELTRAESTLNLLMKQLETEKSKKLTNETKENLIENLNVILLEYHKLERILKENEFKLKTDEELRNRNEALCKQLEIQRTELKKWDLLNKLIGSSDGNKFRKFAQSITMRLLADLANEHLKKISGRYKLIMQNDIKKIDNLELDIIDEYQGGHIRPMDTLSGGETFLVSLALALGLSDMASQNNPVESLFIDEGFGTLDPLTLDMAISALENLQNTGKNIGIISHVGLLKERIPCQIQVNKKGGGQSVIKIV